jgi:hypothetical protein
MPRRRPHGADEQAVAGVEAGLRAHALGGEKALRFERFGAFLEVFVPPGDQELDLSFAHDRGFQAGPFPEEHEMEGPSGEP